MTRVQLYSKILWALAVAACSDQEQPPTTSPDFKVVTDPLNCDFLSVKNLVNSYFSPPVQQTAQGYVSLMESGEGAQSASAIENGFKIMDLIGTASRSASPPSATVGSSLTKALTKCMFNAHTEAYTSLAGGGATGGLDAVAFDMALSPAAGGVYYVVGAGFDFTTTTDFPNVLKGTIDGTYSGNGNYKVSGGTRKSAVGPATLSGSSYVLGSSWATALNGNTDEGGRALVYGYKSSTGTDPLAYEWATIDPGTTFEPYALVSICDGTDPDQNFMVHETGVGVLAFSTADLCNIANYPDATGTATGFRSKFSNTAVSALTLEWRSKPSSPLKVGPNPNSVNTFIARATTTVPGQNDPQGVNGVCLTLTGTNNNGQGTGLINVAGVECPNEPVSTIDNVVTAVTTTAKDPVTQITAAGYATFNFYVAKTGGLILTLDSRGVTDRNIGSATPVVLKYNVKP